MPRFYFERGAISATADGRTEHVPQGAVLEVSETIAFDLAAAGAGRLTNEPVRDPRLESDDAEKTSRSKKIG